MKTNIFAALLLTIVCASAAFGDVHVQLNPDGSAYTSVLVNGTSVSKYDIVFVGDGFTASQQAEFNASVDEAVLTLQRLLPYSYTRLCWFNIWRVNVVSAQSGVDHPRQRIFRDTELGVRYGNAREAEGCIWTDTPERVIEAGSLAPDWDAFIVLANDTQPGGCAGTTAMFSSISPRFGDTVTHELGHQVGHLADEYPCYFCDGSDDNNVYIGPELRDVNLTTIIDRFTTKWADLIDPDTRIPTVDNGNDLGLLDVGLWEGGGYHARGIFRPQYGCLMRHRGYFCQVCARSLRSTLRPRCTPCETDPPGIPCMVSFRPDWQCPGDCSFSFIRWPIPPCLSCTSDFNLPDETVRYVLEGPGNLKLRIIDDLGMLVVEGKRSQTGLEAEFRANKSRQYFAEVSGLGGTTGQLALKSSLFRNGKQQLFE